MRLRSGNNTMSSVLLRRYHLYLSKGKFKQGGPLSLKAFARRFCPGVQLAKTGIRVPLDVLSVQYRCKLNLSVQHNPTIHTSLILPITPFTLPHVILPYACDPRLLAEAVQALNKVRVRYVAAPSGAL